MPVPLNSLISRICCLVILTSSLSLADDVESSRIFLSQNPPIKDIKTVMFGASDPATRKTANKQLDAISKLSGSHEKSDVLLLIPFLGYPLLPSPFLGPTHEVQDDEIRKAWPAFDALLRNPFGAEALNAYILNSTNPLGLRLASLATLRYVDLVRYKSAAAVLTNEIKNGPENIKRRIESTGGLGSPNAAFDGVPRPEKWR